MEFRIRNVTLVEVTDIIKELSNTSTIGHNKLDPLTLKLVAGTITKPIQHILNTSIATKTYCNKWKLGKLLPLFKREGGDKILPAHLDFAHSLKNYGASDPVSSLQIHGSNQPVKQELTWL